MGTPLLKERKKELDGRFHGDHMPYMELITLQAKEKDRCVYMQILAVTVAKKWICTIVTRVHRHCYELLIRGGERM